MLETSEKLQYLHTLVCGEVFHRFDSLYDEVEITNPLTVEADILALGAYFFRLI